MRRWVCIAALLVGCTAMPVAPRGPVLPVPVERRLDDLRRDAPHLPLEDWWRG